MKSLGRIRDVCVLALLLPQLNSMIASPRQGPPNLYTINVRVGLAVLPVTVTDRMKHRVSGLKKGNFQIYEDGHRQPTTLFEDADAPVTVGFVVDNSLSMQPKRAAVLAATVEFAKSSNRLDEIFVVNFNQKVYLELPHEVPFTRSPQELRAALSKFQAGGRTALYDAIGAALNHLKSGTKGKKYLIVVSDGGDNASHDSRSEILTLAKRSDAAIYSVAILNENFSGQDPGFLRKLAHVSGGEFYSPTNVPDVVGALRLIARDIRQQYTLGYVPTNQAEDGKFRHIRVIASAPGEGKLTVRTRDGYLAPGDSTSQVQSPEQPGRKL